MGGDPEGPRSLWLAGLLIAVLSFAALSPLLSAGFVNFDDPVYVTQNAKVQEGLSWGNVKWALTTLYFGFYYPLTWISHMADCQLFGLWAGGHHLTSLLLHALCALALLLLLNAGTGALWRSFFVAALFAVHPLHVESAAWISERKDVLSTLFLFLSLLAYVAYARRPGVARYLGVFLLLLVGLLAKAMLVTAPLLMLLLDYWPLGRARESGGADGWKRWRGLVLEKLPLFGLCALFAALTLYAQAGVVAVGSLASFPPHVRVLNAIISYGLYVVRTVFPLRLAVFYPYYVQDVTLARTMPAALLLLAMTLICWNLRRSRPYALSGWLWFLMSLLPVIGILQAGSQSSADRYTYVASVGLFIVAVWGATEVSLSAPWMKRALVAGAAAVLLGLSVLSWFQAATWHDSVTLFGHAARVTERNYLAHTLLGTALQQRGDLSGAEKHLKQALAFAPDYVDAWGDLGNLFRSEGRLDEAAACYRRIIELLPGDGRAYNNLGLTLERQGRLPEAGAAFARASAISPRDAAFQVNYGRLLAQRGDAPGARARFEAARQLDPNLADAVYYLGVLNEHEGRTWEAEADYRRTLELDPGHEGARQKLAALLERKGSGGGTAP